MSEQASGAPEGTPAGGAMPPAPPAAGGAMPPGQPPPSEPAREAPAAEEPAEDPREAGLGEEGQRLLREARKAARDSERELKRLRDAETARTDAEKTELQRATERAEAAEAKAAGMERERQAQSIAIEEGIPEWWEELRGEDTRTLRAHAQRLRERLGRSSPGMDGGARGLGVPASAQSMDDLIRGGARR